MYKNRKELKAMKKDIMKQIQQGIEVGNNLDIKGFITYGDNIFEGNNDKCLFDGRLTSKEINKYNYGNENSKVYRQGQLIIEILEDEYTHKYDINFCVKVQLIDEYENISDWDFITLNI